MKKIVLTLLLIGTYAKSQTHRFIYDVAYRKEASSGILTKENYHLDISASKVEYYTRDFFIADSLINNNKPFPEEMKLNTSTIVAHKPGDDQYDEYDLMEQTVLRLQTRDTQKWTLTRENKKLKDFTLQKATTTYGGRNWTAWFTKDLPFSEGPYKFHGLPGLIVELYDDQENYRFELMRSQKIEDPVKNQFIEMSRSMSTAVTPEKYKSIKLAYYESPINFIKNSRGTAKGGDEFFLNDGTRVNPQNSREINERLRQTIKKYNNPIDLENAVIYP